MNSKVLEEYKLEYLEIFDVRIFDFYFRLIRKKEYKFFLKNFFFKRYFKGF